ncbi:hypothetical protein AB832_04110 [Flavobacteriaceae bacterium (ex Bugula neritina AB1)]|nr:hypothetical protein AB832_04110 [Flavobacteriaceae bacterium (ex Bugula neritina AB1)]
MISINNIFRTDNEKYIPLFFLLLIGYQFFLSFQGFDVCDEGWVLTFYQQIFSAPETVEYNFLYWLTGIFGGVWYNLFPTGGIISFRILTIITTTILCIISYNILKKHVGKYQILLGLWIVLLLQDYGLIVFHHNHLSSLLSIVSIYLIINGLKNNSSILILLSGFIIGLNIFSRLPNITLTVYILLIPLYAYLTRKKIKDSIPQALIFLSGALISFVFVFIALSYLDHIDIFKKALSTLFLAGKGSDSNHNFLSLLKAYISNYRLVIQNGISILACLTFILFIFKIRIKNTLLKKVLIILSTLVTLYFLRGIDSFSLYFLGFMGSIFVIIRKTASPEFKLIAIAAMLMMVFLPLGSDYGISNMGYYTLWLSIPIFIWSISELKTIRLHIGWNNNNQNNVVFGNNTIKNSFLIVLFVYIIIKLYQVSHNAYFDPGSRFEKTTSINSIYAKGIKTTKTRAQIINEVLPALTKHTKPGDYLLAYDNLPMLHFLTDTKPYMYNSWVWVYDSFVFDTKLKKAENVTSKLPVVILQKFNTLGNFSTPQPDYMSTDKKDDYRYKKGRVIAMSSFLQRNNYKTVWSNEYFDILTPEDISKANE